MLTIRNLVSDLGNEKSTPISSDTSFSSADVSSPESRPKKRKTIDDMDPREQLCIICKCVKHKSVTSQ